VRNLRIRVARAILPRDHSVYLVWDTSGMGRPVGIFHDAEVAHRAQQVNPNYYRVHQCALDEVAANLAGWATGTQLEQLHTLIKQNGI